MQFFESNISSLQTQNLGFAQKIQSIKEVEEFELFMDEGDYSTLNFIHKTDFIPLYESKPQDEIAKSTEEFQKFENYPYLYMYGLGNGTLIKRLLENEKLKRIVVIEPEIEIAHIVLHVLDFSQELREGRVVLFGSDDVSLAMFHPLFPTLQEQRYARVYDMHTNTAYYQKKHSESLLRANQIMLETIYHAINIAGNDTKDALIGLKQHIINVPKMLNTPPLGHLFKLLNFKESAVLVSTGPSLTKQLPLLKKIAPYVRIVAVDASFPVLYREGIKPDVVVSMERVPQSARFFKELPKEAFDDVIFALSSLQHKDVVESIKGGQMQMSMRPLGFMTYMGPDQWGYMGIGQSAANMAYELIFQSRFKNCILIGQDLAYAEDGSSHADGHVFGVDNVKQKETDVWTVGWGGKNAVRTNHTWTMFRNFFEKDVFDTQGILTTINATEGGARIAGTLELPFAEVIKKYVQNKKKKPKISFMKVLDKEKIRLFAATEKKLDEMALFISNLLEELKELFLETAALSEKIEKQEPYSASELENLLNKIDGLKKYHQDKIYEDVVWHIAQSMMLVQELRIAPLDVYKPQNELQELERLELLIHAYKPWLFSYCGILDATLKTISYARARRFINEVETVDVYLGDEKIDSFDTKKLESNMGRVFDVDMRGLLYDVADEYQTHLSAVTFRDAKHGDELPREFVNVIKRDDDKYRELRFVKHLEELADQETIKETSFRDAIGFMATEKNLDDTAFIEFVKILKEQKYNVPFVAFCFNEMQRKKALEVFGEDTEIVFPETLEDVALSVSVYLYSSVSKDHSLFSDDKTRHLLIKKDMNLFVVHLQSKIESDNFTAHLSLQKADVGIDFSSSLISKILKGHEKFSEYSLINSFDHVIKNSALKNMSSSSAIGFVATKENLEDKDYTQYIKDLMKKFPKVEFIAYAFDGLEQAFIKEHFNKFHISILGPVEHIGDILQKVAIWIDGPFTYSKNTLQTYVWTHLLYEIEDIYCLKYSREIMHLTIEAFDQLHKNHPFLENPEVFDFSVESDAFKEKSLSKLIASDQNLKVNESQLMSEFLDKQIELSLDDINFRRITTKRANKLKYYNKVKI